MIDYEERSRAVFIEQTIHFVISSTEKSPSEISKELGLQPDESFAIGSRDAERVIPRHHIWKMHPLGEHENLEDGFDELMARLGESAPRIRAIVDEGAVASFEIWRTFVPGSPIGIELGMIMDQTTVQFAASIGACFNISEVNEIDELTDEEEDNLMPWRMTIDDSESEEKSD